MVSSQGRFLNVDRLFFEKVHRLFTSVFPSPTIRSECAATLLTLIIATTMPLDHASAQTLDTKIGASAGSGLLVTSSGSSTYTDRTPFHLNIDTAFIFDGDTSLEWTAGTIIQLENTPAFALNPKVRLVRETRTIDIYAAAGLPWFVLPFRRLGIELGGGVMIPLNELFSIVGGLAIQTFFAGADIPEGTAVLELNGRFGVRIAF